MGQSMDRKKTATMKVCRSCQKNVQDTQNALQPMERPIQLPLLDSSHCPLWYSKEKLNHLSLPQLFSYVKVLEDLIQQKFNQLLWGISSVMSEAVVATAWAPRKSSSEGNKTVRFTDARDPIQLLSLSKEPPQLFQDQHLPHQLVTPSLKGATGVQELENVPSSRSEERRSSSQRRANRRAHPTTEIGIQTSLPNVNESSKHGLNWKDIASCNVQKCQAAISHPTDNLSRGTLPFKTIRSASILPEHYQMIHHHEKPQPEEKAIDEGKQKGTHGRFCSSRELTQLQEAFQLDSDGYCKNLLEPNQPAQPSILNSKSYKSSQMAGSVPSGVPLKKAISNFDMLSRFKKSHSVGAKDLPCTSSSTPGDSLEPSNSALRTDELLSINTSDNLSFLDSNTKMKLEYSILQNFVKCKRRLLCVSKAEKYPKAAMILEKLHHHDPGGIRVETVSSSRLESPLFEHSTQGTQRAPPTAASHGPVTSHLDQQQRNQSVQPHTFCSHAKPQQSGTIQGTGRGNLQSNTSPVMAKHAPWKQSEDAPSGHPHLSTTTVGPEDRVPPSIAKQTNTLKVKEELPPAWRVSLGPSEISNGQAINIILKGFESVDAKRSPDLLQTPITQNSGHLALKIKLDNNMDLKSSEQLQSWPVSHRPDAPNTVHPARVNLPSQNSLPNFQNGWQNLRTSQGLGDVLMSSDQSVEIRDFRVHKDKSNTENDSVFYPPEVRTTILKSGDISQEERPGRVIPSLTCSIQLKDEDKTESQSSLNIVEKREEPAISFLKNSTRNTVQYEDHRKTYKGQGGSLRNEIPLPVTGLQEVLDRESLFYSTAVELQALVNALLQNLEKNIDDPSKLPIDPVIQVPEDKVESLAFQMGDSTYSSEGLYGQNHRRPARRMSSGHTSSEEHKHPFEFSGIGVKAQSGIDTQRTCDLHLNKAKRIMDFFQFPTLMGNDYPCCYTGDGNKQESGLANQKASDPGQSGTKIGLEDSPHGSPKGHNHSFRYTEIRDKQEPVDHKVFDPHKNTKKRVACGQLMSPTDNHPVKDRGSGIQEQSAAAAQGASDKAERRTKRGKECSPHRSPEMHNHSLRYREVRDESQPSVNAQSVCDQHLNSQKRRFTFDNLHTPKENNHRCRHRTTGDKQHLGFADQKVCDPGQIGMGPCPHKSPKGHNLSFRYREIEENGLSCVRTQRTHDEHPNSVKRRGFDNLPTAKGKNHPYSYKVIRDKQQSCRADLRACDPGRIKKESGMAGCIHTCPDGYNFLFRYKTIGNNEQPGIVLTASDPHQITKEEMCHGQPMSPRVKHSVKHRETGGQDQSGVASQGASELR